MGSGQWGQSRFQFAFFFRLHPLKGSLKGFWAVTVRANWRVTFRFHGQDARDVDLIDYH